MIVFR